MAQNERPIEFRDYLPKVFRADEVSGINFLSRFLTSFEALYEELEGAIEGTPDGDLRLTVQSGAATVITVASFDSGVVGFPVGTPVTVFDEPVRTILNQKILANQSGLTEIEVQDAAFVAGLQSGDALTIHAGGMPDLFDPDTTPPPQLTHRPLPDFDYLEYLASWIALPLRAEKSVAWNRRFLNIAIPLYPQRSTLPGMDALLRAWLKDDLLETDPLLLILTDLTRVHTDIDATFQLGETATLGVDTVMGEGAPFFFIADLITDPEVKALRHPVGLDVFQRAALFLLCSEKPAYTYYQLRVRAHTMQLTPPAGGEVAGEVYAQIGETTLLWAGAAVFDSDC